MRRSGEYSFPNIPSLETQPAYPRRAIYEKLDYSVKDVQDAVGAPITLSDDKVTVVMGRMRMPSLSLHGIEGAFYGPGAKTVIPASVSGKFSIRYVYILTSPRCVTEFMGPIRVVQYRPSPDAR